MSTATTTEPKVLRPAPEAGARDTATWALAMDFWPVALRSSGETLENERVATGKEPLRNAWGNTRPTLESLRADFAGHDGRGVGLRLGPTGGWSDIEGDGPGWLDQFVTLCGGETLETLGWDSRRGGHNMVLPPPPELANIPSGFKAPWSEYTDLEVRLNGKDSQSQSVVPPTVTDEFPRRWRGPWQVAPLPEATVAELAKLWQEDQRRKKAASQQGGRARAKYRKEGDGTLSTIDAWNQEQGAEGIVEMLVRDGWRVAKRAADDVVYLAHPNATAQWSASVGWCGQRLYCWSNNTAFPVQVALDAFDVYRILEHGDDFRRALTALRERGYGPAKVRVKVDSVHRNVGGEASSDGDGKGPIIEGGPTPDDDHPTFAMTDLGNCERFARDHADVTRHVGPWRKWLVFVGGRWIIDETGAVVRLAKKTVRGIAAEAAELDGTDQFKEALRWAARSEDARQIGNMIRLAESEKRIAVSHKGLDADPWLFNVRNGTIDLRTGTLRPHDRADLITRMAPVNFDPDATCPLWKSELETVFGGDRDLISFFRRLAGYWMTGVVRDQILPIAYGKGRNGKSTVIGSLLRILGDDYAYEADPALIMQRSSNDHPTEKAALFGKRMVSLSETDSGKRLNEALVKRLTGKEQITARRMREDPWSFWPTHKLILSTNHRPEIRGTDTAIWRRVLLIPFTVTIDPKDEITDFADRLAKEEAGILAWCVRGCLEWQRDGLNPPASVAAATKDYRDSQDALASFIVERCVVSASVKGRSGEMYKAYCEWAKENGEETLGSRTFYEAMAERGHPSKVGSSNRRYMEGIALRQNHEQK